MSLKNVDIESGLRRLAEKRIEDAMAEGKFDNLPGAGKPLDLEPMPADEKARLMWWALRIMKSNNVTPDEVQWRKSVDLLKLELTRARDEAQVKTLVTQINTLVHKLHTLGTNAIHVPITGVDLEEELEKFRRRKDGG